ncbi:BTAD domain-containing putative transcriptional regulator [Prauserella flavalba]|uniref:SARP family transcriptional regulator n=1 Tax=Prauserella flavalba TaxID=1477506 RepID=A0A318LU75_9PSEU|nr:BTAD domain-containing putative transcriptional regulator [Prauserella flavalba]PXY35898.1 SARP family transcriptional regulator [Prauserella flavalba]
MGSSVRFGVLGPLVAEDAGGAVDLKGPRHRAVLARLLIARGRVVPVHRLVDDLWVSPPDGAVGAIQTFVGALRKALEPDRPPRTPARLLVTVPPGYALRAEADAVDAWRFEAGVTASGEALARGDARGALTTVDEALAWWRGPAYAGFADEPWARGEVTRLDELRLLAVERRAQALLDLGRGAEAVPDLEAHLEARPWREEAWRLLALARYRAGRQGDALETLRRARAVLAGELGVDPGPALRELESDILAQSPRLDPAPAVRMPTLVGRAAELDRLIGAADAAVARGRLGLALVSGEAGAGKTALAEALSARLADRGWVTAWGASPEQDGSPAAWPWTRILTELAAEGTVPAEPGPGTAPATARFEWHRAVAGFLGTLARRAPLSLVLDDLHWAGEATLELLAALGTDPVPAPVLVVATYRTTDTSPALTALLGRLARAEPARVYLGGLPAGELPALVRATTGREIDAATAGALHERTGGNPFFVRELARLLDTEGGLSGVPAGVRDVVRYRLDTLPESVRTVLREAAVVGTEVDLELLSGDDALDAAETATAAGFLVEHEPGRFRFAHALLRDTLYADLSASRRARLHAAVAGRLERLRPGDVAALAHHHLLAGTAVSAERTVRYTRAAAEHAERRFAPHEAARLWRAALAADDRAGDGDVRHRLDLIMGLVRAQAVTGALGEARDLRAEALTLAERLGDPVLTARVLGAFDVPAIWTEPDDPALAHRIAEVAERTLAALAPDESALRGRLLATLALELRNTGGDRAREAAELAESVARSVGDPGLLAFALNARFMQSFDRAGLAPERVRIGTELLELATTNALVTFEVLGHLVLVQAHSALADFHAADRHAQAAGRLGDDHDIPLVGVFTQWYEALRTAVTGPPAAAEAAYRVAATRLSGTGMSGVDNGILPLALLCHRLQRGGSPDPGRDIDFGGYTPWCRPLVLLAEGRTAEAREPAIPASPRDLLFEARTCLHAVAAIALGDQDTMARLYTELEPAAGELAGAGSGLVTLGPVAHHLGDLAAALGRRAVAGEHYRQALDVAERAGAPHWAEAARRRLG